MPVFFITAEQVRNGTVTITGPLCDHLRASLRLQIGEAIWVGDDRRRRYLIRVSGIDRRSLRGHILEERAGAPAVNPSIIAGQALIKGDRMDWVIQKSTELGVAALTPLVASHTIVRPHTTRLAAQRERWQRIALEAAQQAERWDIPLVEAPCSCTEFFERQGSRSLKLILSERADGQSLSSMALPTGPDNHIVIAVGPEGGWTAEEIRTALDSGFAPITLGKRILRAETATLAALSVLQSRLGELG
jgi:16S rRNA (uracil1498-N3)-methyltransferase